MFRTGVAVVSLLAVIIGSRPASAQDNAARDQARALMHEGNRLYQDGDYLQALDRFQKVWDLVQTPKVHFNLGETYFQLGRPLDALTHYELFVQEIKEADAPEFWARANTQISKLQGKVATILVQCPVVGATITVDGSVAGKTPVARGIRVLPGPHVVLLTKPGYEQVVLKLTLGAGDVASRKVELLTEEVAARQRASYRKLEAQRRAAQERLRAEQERSRARTARTKKALRISGWTGLAVGLAGVAVGGTCGLLARKEASKIEGAETGTPWLDLAPHKDRYDLYRQISYYGMGIGAGLAVAGGVLLLVSYWRTGEERPAAAPDAPVAPEPRARLSSATLSAAPAIGPSQLGVMVRGTF